MNRDALDRVLASLDGPMAIVTTSADGERSGCLIGFHTQCSIDPPRWLVCISKKNHTFGVALRAHAVAVHFLRVDQHELAEIFGSETLDDRIDKFAQCGWRPGPLGIPVLAGCDWIVGRVVGRLDTGDHEGHLLEIVEAGHEHADAPQLGFQHVRGIEPGHPP